MATWYLGFCSQCPDSFRTGRIAPLASLRKNPDGKFIVDRLADDLDEVFGPTKKVFWHNSPTPLQDLTGAVVRFQCIRTQDHSDTPTAKDWMRVFRGGKPWEEKPWEVHRIGYRIIGQGENIQWQQEPRWVRGFGEGEHLVIRNIADKTVFGPWRVGRDVVGVQGARELIPHPNPNKIIAYETISLKEDAFFGDYESFAEGKIGVEVLLYLPDESVGKPVDLATPKQLGNWLVKRIVAHAPKVVETLDKEAAGWRSRVREEIEMYDEHERQLYLARWDKIDAILKDLVFESESTTKLIENPKFLHKVNELIKTEVGTRTAEIEAEAQQKSKNMVARTQTEILDAQRQLEAIKKDSKNRLDDLAGREQAVKALISHLKESRDRLLKDITVYQGLLPGAPAAAVEHPRRPSTTSAIRPNGEAIETAAKFIDLRLWPALDRWYPGASRNLALTLHATICGSRTVLVPSPAWAQAYVSALGGTAILSFVNIQPTWLGFDDLWRGGLSEVWERAGCEPAAIEIVLFRDFNRALPQCYARPLLDLLAGYTDELPWPGSGAWPKNLRILACTSPSDESLPLTYEVIRHFAAVSKTLPSPSAQRPEPETPGHVAVETWLNWSHYSRETEPDAELSREFGPLARAAALEIATIAMVLKDAGMNEREANSTGRDLRVDNPAQYGIQPIDQTGVGR